MKRAFTLVELLVTIGIIAVLIGLLMPIISRVRSSAQMTHCASNLRQIATAAVDRVNTTRGYLPLAGYVIVPGNTTGYGSLPSALMDAGRTRYLYIREQNHPLGDNPMEEHIPPFPAAILPSLSGSGVVVDSGTLSQWETAAGRTAEVFRCPAATVVDDAISPPVLVTLVVGTSRYQYSYPVRMDYALNAGLLGFDAGRPGRALAGKVSAIRNTSQVVLAGDIAIMPIPTAPMICWVPSREMEGPVSLGDIIRASEKVVHPPDFDQYRHRGKTNVLFLDGHVEALAITADGLDEALLLE